VASPSSTLVDLVLRGAGRLSRGRSLPEEVARKAEKPDDPAPRFLGRDVSVEELTLRGLRCYRLSPASAVDRSDRHVLYLHGGSYTFEISPIHWWNLGRLVRATGATFTVVIYTLAPAATADGTVAAVAALGSDLAGEHPGLVIAGDSAGGGMALAAAQALVSAGVTSVQRLVLIAPWLDVTMTDPALDAIESKDVMLRRDSLIAAGALYAGDLDPSDPRVSPIHGSMAGLPPTTVLVGTHDLLLADARAFVAKAGAAGVDVALHEQAGAQHVYPLLPTREGKAGRALLVEALR
jgi:acetyl esterase/lipase